MNIDELLKLSPPLLLMVVLGCLGQTIKTIPSIPNWIIPIALPLVGAAAYTLIGAAYPIAWIAQVHYPWIVHGMVGFILGSATVGVHQQWSQWTGRHDKEVTNATGPNSTLGTGERNP